MGDKPNGKPTEKDESGLGGLSQPGQRVIEEINPLTESLAIERKASLLTKSVFMVELMIAIPIILAFLTWGYVVILIMVETGIVLCFIGMCRFLEYRANRRGDETYNVAIPAIVSAATMLLLAIFWGDIIGAASFRHRLMYLAMAMTVYFSVPILYARVLLIYRMGGEVADQNPRKAMDYPKFVMPWTNLKKLASWNITPTPPLELPSPTPEDKKEPWLIENKGDSGRATWDYYMPPDGISNEDVYNAMKVISMNYDPERHAFVWPGDSKMPFGSKKHPKLQLDWRRRKWAEKQNDNTVILLPQGIRTMGKILAEPKPNGKN